MLRVSSHRHHFDLALLAALILPLPLRGEYKEPDFRKEIFDMSGIILGPDERAETVNALAALAANFHVEGSVSDDLREMALAVALRMEPTNRAALGTHRSLAESALPVPVSGSATKVAIAERLWKTAEKLDDADTDDDERALRCYLLDIARRIDPDNGAGHAAFQKAAARGPFPGWKGILGRETEDTFVFPQEGPARAGSNNDPKADPTPGQTRNTADLKGTTATIKYPAPSGLEAAGTRGRLVEITLNVNAEAREPGQPIRILYPSAVAGSKHPLSVTADTLVVALRGTHSDWPASGNKVIARFNAPYTGADGRAGELPVALALDALYRGTEVPKGLAAMGGVEVDGSISPVPDVLSRLVVLKAADGHTIVVPAANENALLDVLVTGEIVPLLRYQIFTVITLREALALVEEPVPAALRKARLDFTEVRDVVLKSGQADLVVLRTEVVRERLRGILKLAPGHASARLLLRFSLGDVPKKMSLAGSRLQIGILLGAYRPFMEATGDLLVTGDAEQLRGKTTAALTAVRNKIDPAVIPLADALGDFALAFEEYGKVKFKGSQQGRTMKEALTTRWDGILKDLASPMTGPDAAPAETAIDFGLDDPALPR